MADFLTARAPEASHFRSVRRLSVGVALLGVCIASGGCLRGQAKALPEIPLEVPAPPPRSVEAVNPAEPLIVSFPEEPVPNTPSRPQPAPPPRADNRPAEPRPEPVEPPKPAEDAGRGPLPPLQTTPTQQEGEAERRVRVQLSQATTSLNRINVQALNADARQQFETARRFVSQAEDALRTRNLVFARNLAEKAAALALQLSGR